MVDFGDAKFERERRFLVADRSILEGRDWELITQAYVFAMNGFAIRVRLVQRPDVDGSLSEGFAQMTGKGPRVGSLREEYETPVSTLWARSVINHSANVVVKRRHQVVLDQVWEVDEFLEANAGLIVAELEGGDEISSVRLPTWAVREIVTEPALDNESLAVRPVAAWDKEERGAIGLER